MTQEDYILVQARQLKKYYPVKRGLLYKTVDWIKAVDGVSLEIKRGQTLGLVGESGCGKTTLGRALLRLVEPDGGRIFFEQREITHIPAAQMRSLRRRMQIVFQDPYDSLDPRFTAGRTVAEGLRIFWLVSKTEAERKSRQLLEMVGISGEAINRYPHEFSGGQRQRIGIARAVSLEPSFLVLDEPVSSLDVSVQAQIINLLSELQERLRLTYLFITHDLNVIRHVADNVAVMYLGKLVETAKSEEIFVSAQHPYTKVLFAAMPTANPNARRMRTRLKGEVSEAMNIPGGCRFRLRCPDAMKICEQQEPSLKKTNPGHSVACHLFKSHN